ncbi:MAG: hypothetical protein ACREFR_20000, partial [Limisphaerales bacterium]
MKTIIIFLGISLAGGCLFLAGCSKSGTGVSAPGNSNSNSNSAAAPSGAGGSAESRPVEMKLKWQIGKRYNMQIKLDRSTDMTVDGQSVQREIKLTQDFHYLPLKKLDNGGYQVELDFDRQNFDLFQNGTEMVKVDT